MLKEILQGVFSCTLIGMNTIVYWEQHQKQYNELNRVKKTSPAAILRRGMLCYKS